MKSPHVFQLFEVAFGTLQRQVERGLQWIAIAQLLLRGGGGASRLPGPVKVEATNHKGKLGTQNSDLMEFKHQKW